MLGKDYLVEHVAIGYRQNQRAEAWKSYIADGLMVLTENTATWPGSKSLAVRYSDVVSSKPKEKQKTGDEIAADVINRIGLKFKGKEVE